MITVDRFIQRHGNPGSAVVFPNPVKVPSLMESFSKSLETAGPTPEAAIKPHYDLTAIHPLGDGNGRTGRLLMNLMLIRTGYPPVAVRPEDRARYFASLEEGQLGEGDEAFKVFMYGRLDAMLADYLELLDGTILVDRA